MAKKSLADLQAQIEKLRAQAHQLREQEKAGVVARIGEAITDYELSEADLFSVSSIQSARPKRGKAAPTRSAAYADATRSVWGGRGPRPRSLRQALQQWRSMEEFATGGQPGSAPPAADASQAAYSNGSNGAGTSRRGAGKTARKSGRAAGKASITRVPVKYRDDAGNSWSGRGLQPKWLKEALAAGGSLESFCAGA